jgi:hypothetical protein
MGSFALIYKKSFIKIGSGIQKLRREDAAPQTQNQKA